MADNHKLAADLAAERYIHERLSPQRTDSLYLHLIDLRTALDHYSTPDSVMVLDFGCGSSPYRSLFPQANYHRADYIPSADLDYVVGADQRVNAPSGNFDFVLSTQVLEHVREVDVYLAECFRVLKPGGTLLLTTHGIFEDHGCPYDFHRWTADGLRSQIEALGFIPSVVTKLTTSGRAVAFFLSAHGRLLARGRRTLLGFANWLLIDRPAARARFHSWCDHHLSECSSVDGDTPGHNLYIGLLICARKPAES